MRPTEFYRRANIGLLTFLFAWNTVVLGNVQLVQAQDQSARTEAPVSWTSPGGALPALPPTISDWKHEIPAIVHRLAQESGGNVGALRGPQMQMDLLSGGLDLTLTSIDVDIPTPLASSIAGAPPQAQGGDVPAIGVPLMAQEGPGAAAMTSPPQAGMPLAAPGVPSAPVPASPWARRAEAHSPVTPKVVPRSYSWSYRLMDVKAGSQTLFQATQDVRAESGCEDGVAVYPRTLGLYEVYEAKKGGVEQSFVLTAPPQFPGDLVLGGQVKSDLAARNQTPGAEGILYQDPQSRKAILSYGLVAVYDAKGRKTLAQTMTTSEGLETRVSGAWLASATYPVVIDPLVGNNFQISSQSVSDIYCSVAYNSVLNEYMVVWENSYSSNDHDVYGQRVTASGTLNGSVFPIRTSTAFEGTPKIAYSPSSRKYFVAMQYQHKDIIGTLLNEDGTINVSAFYIDAFTNGVSEQPDICYRSTNDEFLIVWSDSNNSTNNGYYKLYGSTYHASNATVDRSNILLRSVTATHLNDPAVAYNSTNDVYFLTYESSNSHVYGFGYDGGLTTMTTGVVTLSTDTTHTQLYTDVAWNSSANEYMAMWQSNQGGNYDIYGQRVGTDGSLHGGNVVVSAQARDEADVELVYETSTNRYQVTWDWQTASGNYVVQGQEVDASGNLVGSMMSVSANAYPANADFPAIAYNSSNAQSLIVWQDGRNGSTFQIWGQLVSGGAPTLVQEPERNPIQIGARGSIFGHSGEFHWTATDLVIPGRGPAFAWTRTWRAINAQTNGPMGYGWDFTYDERLVGANQANVTRYDGMGRSDTYTWNSGPANWTSPAGFYDTLTYQSVADTFTITDRYETVRTFSNQAGTYRIATLADRNGNTLTFGYNGSHQLTTVTDTLGRVINIGYTAGGLVDHVTDFNSRTVQYGYDANGNLQTERTPTSSDYPSGKTTTYGYLVSGTPWLNHNLSTITDPKSQQFLVNTYDAGTDKVTTQQYGTAAQTYAFTYAAGQTTMLDRVGNQKVYNFNANGNATSVVEVMNRGVRGGEGPYTTSYTYNANFEVTQVTFPRGNDVQYTFDINNASPPARGNLLSIRQQIGTVGGGDADIVTSMTYESTFNQVKTYTEPRGFVTTYFYDYEEATLGDLNGDGITNQANGNLVEIQYPNITSGQPATQVILEKIWWNGNGQMLRRIEGEGNATSYSYYSAGAQNGYLQTVTRAAGSLNLATNYTYDAVGNVLTVQNPRGFTTTYSVNSLNEVLQVTPTAPFASYTVNYTYDANDNASQVSAAWIDENGNAYGGSPLNTVYAFDTLNMPTSIQQATGSGNITTSYTLDKNENVTDTTFPQSNVTHVVYDERDLVYQTTRGNGTADASTETRNYDGNRNLSTLINGAGHTVSTRTYDGFDRVKTDTDSLSNHTDTIYYPCCVLVNTVTRYNSGGTTLSQATFFWDEIKRKYKEQRLFNNSAGQPQSGGTVTTQFLYDRNSRLTQVTDGNNGVTVNGYDTADRLTSTTDPLGASVGNQVTYTLDNNGNATTVVSNEYNQRLSAMETFTVSNQYDELDRRNQAAVDPSGLNLITVFKYNSRNDNTVVIDPLAHQTTRTFDGLSRLTATKYDDGGLNILVQQAWDGNSRLTSQTDANNNSTSYQYTNRDQVKTITYADNTTKTMTYTLADQVYQVTDANGSQVTNTYNAMELITQRDITRGSGVVGTTQEQYTYDGQYRMLSAKNLDSGTTIANVTMAYNTLGGVDTETEQYFGGATHTVSRTFDPLGNRTSVTYPGGRVISYAFDLANRITTVTEGVNNIATYQWAGQRVARRTYPNGMQLLATYDTAKRATSWLNQDAMSNDRASFTYAYDKAGNRLWENRVQDGLADVYNYDGIYEVTGTKYGVPSADLSTSKAYGDYATYNSIQTFIYDKVGNREEFDNGATTYLYNRPAGGGAYTPSPMNEYYRIRINGVDTNRTYDANGNLSNDGTFVYKYNYKNELIEVDPAGGGAAVESANYNCFGLRIYKQASPAVYYLYDGPHFLETHDFSSDLLLSSIVFGAGGPGGGPGGGPDAVIQVNNGGGNNYPCQNALGSLALWTDDSANNVEKATYTAPGLPTSYTWFNGAWVTETGPKVAPFLFTGRDWDASIGKYYYRARYMSPLEGRFTTRDPLNPVVSFKVSCCGCRRSSVLNTDALANLYTYVGNQSTAVADPSGMVRIPTSWTDPSLDGALDALDKLAGLVKGKVGQAARDALTEAVHCDENMSCPELVLRALMAEFAAGWLAAQFGIKGDTLTRKALKAEKDMCETYFEMKCKDQSPPKLPPVLYPFTFPMKDRWSNLFPSEGPQISSGGQCPCSQPASSGWEPPRINIPPPKPEPVILIILFWGAVIVLAPVGA